MKIILKEEIMTDAGNIGAGAILDLPDHIARQWIDKGKAKAVSKIERAVIEPLEKRTKRKGKK